MGTGMSWGQAGMSGQGGSQSQVQWGEPASDTAQGLAGRTMLMGSVKLSYYTWSMEKKKKKEEEGGKEKREGRED